MRILILLLILAAVTKCEIVQVDRPTGRVIKVDRPTGRVIKVDRPTGRVIQVVRPTGRVIGPPESTGRVLGPVLPSAEVVSLKANESIDSIFEKDGYFAFKLKSEKLQRRVALIQEQSMQQSSGDYDRGHLNSSFVTASELELRLAGFYYDEAEHKERMNATFSDFVASICSSFPRYLIFDHFVFDDGQIRGRLQESGIDEKSLNEILSKHGFMNRNVSDISRGEKSGFVVVRHHNSLEGKPEEQLSANAKVFLEKPLRTSVFVDTLYACTENDSGTCDELSSMKIEKCA